MSDTKVNLLGASFVLFVTVVVAIATVTFLAPWMIAHQTKATMHAVSVGRVWSIGETATYEYVVQTGEEKIVLSRMLPFRDRYISIDMNRRCDCVTRVYFKDTDDSWFSMYFEAGDRVSVRRGLDTLSLNYQEELTKEEALIETQLLIDEAMEARQYLRGLVDL